MYFHKLRLALIAATLTLLPFSAIAVELGFVNSNIWTSKTSAIVGERITIFAVLVNNSDQGLSGNVVFEDNTGRQLGTPVPFTLNEGGTSNVLSAVWTATAGDYRFRAKIIDAMRIDNLGRKTAIGSEILSQVTNLVTVRIDTDHDGVSDEKEKAQGSNPNNPDSDGDTLPDNKDPNPTNRDTDGDGDPDGSDPNPTNNTVFTPRDTDKDGTPDTKDSDADNDGLYNWQETKSTGGIGTDQLKYDTDGDGIGDKQDAYPRDSKRWVKNFTNDASAETTATSTTNTGDESELTDADVLGEKITNRLPAFIGDTTGSIFPWWFKYIVSIWLILLLLFLFLYGKKRKKDRDGDLGPQD